MVNFVLFSSQMKQTHAEFDKFWNQRLSEVSQLDVEVPTLPRKQTMHKHFDQVTSHHFFKKHQKI